MGRLCYSQNYCAVSGACHMIKKSIFDKVGGLNEIFITSFYDIDLCMEVRKQNYLICWTPYAKLRFQKSISRFDKKTVNEQNRYLDLNNFKDKWHNQLENGDPYYNKNLSLDRGDFSIDKNKL